MGCGSVGEQRQPRVEVRHRQRFELGKPHGLLSTSLAKLAVFCFLLLLNEKQGYRKLGTLHLSWCQHCKAVILPQFHDLRWTT